MLHRILLVAASLLALHGQAQGVYKVVGADGKITYTDRPPPPAADTVVKPFGARPATPPERAVRATTPGVDAAVKVHTTQIMVQMGSRFCRALAVSPHSAPGAKNAAIAATQAAARWEERHAELTQQKIFVLQDRFTKAELLQFVAHTEGENSAVLARIAQAPGAKQLGWCQQIPAMLVSDEFDLRSNLQLVETLMHYLPRQRAPVVKG